MSYSMDGLDSESGLDFLAVAKNATAYTRNTRFLLFTAAFVVGNLLLQSSAKLLSFSHMTFIGFALLILVFALTYYSGRKLQIKNMILGLVLLGLCLGYSRAWLQANNYLKHSLAPDVMSQDVQIPACISSIPQTQSGFSRFIIRPLRSQANQASLIHLKNIRLSVNLKQFGDSKTKLEFKAGECWHWNLRLKTTRGLRNKHGFDYEKWLYLQDVGATAYIRALPQKIAVSKYPWLSLRSRLAEEIKQALPQGSNITGLILGLSLGMRDDIETSQWQILQNTGTSHLLAISGLHIGIAALFGFYFGKILYLLLFRTVFIGSNQRFSPLNCALVSSMIFAIFYAAMAGFSVSTQRACIMLITLSVCSIGARKFKASSIFCIALIAVLIFDPKAILSAGTWFSFLAVAVLLILVKREKHFIDIRQLDASRKKQKLIQAIKLQFFLVLFLAVPVALVFSKVSIVSPLVNFLLIPIFSFTVVPVLLVSLLFISVNQELAFKFLNVEHDWLELIWKFLEVCSNLPLAQLDLQLSPVSALLFNLLLLPLILPKGVLNRAYCLVLLLPFMFGFSAKPLNPGELDITVFDVGQGLSVLLKTSKHQVLYDTGPAFRNGSSSAGRVIKPWLYAENIHSLSALIISHSDNDHSGGLNLIKQSFTPKQIFAPAADSIDYTLACESGVSWVWDNVRFEFIYPLRKSKNKKKNNNSCVLRVSLHGKSLLISGDIEKEAERALLSQYSSLKSHILIVPHHGSRTSSTIEFVNSVKPQIAVIPAGFANRWRFPKADILNRWQKASGEVHTIAETGELNFHIDAKGQTSTKTWISTQCRYWHQDCQK